MPTVTVKMTPSQHARLQREAKKRRTSQSAVLREAFDNLGSESTTKKPSFAERAAHLIGCLEGPADLSARSKEMKGYGESRHP
ncbi:ribbon-helix-helix domain-containing protein [Opitutaceae bacterium]|nr:ribbon-helix-helix domain-containing protein [Opitutaceae bacterium]